MTGAVVEEANAAGWHRGPVTVRWSAVDGLSGVDPATTAADTVVDAEGADLAATSGPVADLAGNLATGTLAGLRVDRTAPAVTGAVVDEDGEPRTRRREKTTLTLTITCRPT